MASFNEIQLQDQSLREVQVTLETEKQGLMMYVIDIIYHLKKSGKTLNQHVGFACMCAKS